MKKKTVLQLAKLQRSGTILQEPLASQLKKELLECSSYQKAAGKENMVLKVLTRKIYRRSMKTVFITYGNTCIPIVATKLYASKNKRGCRTCGNVKCHKTTNNSLLRRSIESQIKSFRYKIARKVAKLRGVGSKRTAEEGAELKRLASCALTGKPLVGNIHVDHIVPFSVIVNDWCKEQKISLCDKKLGIQQLKQFEKYHNEVAQLQLTLAKANMKAGAKGY